MNMQRTWHSFLSFDGLLLRNWSRDGYVKYPGKGCTIFRREIRTPSESTCWSSDINKYDK